MSKDAENINPLFLQLVLSLQSAAWYQLGKTVSPMSGKIERNLEEARVSIDLLTMLQEKTKGNLLEEERKILDNTVYTLQMNYVDELNQDKEKEEKPPPESKEKPSADEPDAGEKESPSKEASENK
jgi:hypothetical protein